MLPHHPLLHHNAGFVMASLLLEAACGYPARVFARVGHPVSWWGALIAVLRDRWNLPGLSPGAAKWRGIACLCVLLGSALAAAAAARLAADVLPGDLGVALLAALGATLPAQRGLHDHVSAVGSALARGGIVPAREAVGRIVGRDVAQADEPAVLRAAIESLAENFADGVVAPALWGLAGGLPLMLAYKVANTADSMLGHRTPRLRHFGWASARFDDLVNLPASRLAAGLLLVPALLSDGFDAAGARRAVRRDARRHRSPNAGWPEAAMAGALGLRLAGPRRYGGMAVDDAFMGDGRPAPAPADLARALTLYRRACVAQFALAAAVFALT